MICLSLCLNVFCFICIGSNCSAYLERWNYRLMNVLRFCWLNLCLIVSTRNMWHVNVYLNIPILSPPTYPVWPLLASTGHLQLHNQLLTAPPPTEQILQAKGYGATSASSLNNGPLWQFLVCKKCHSQRVLDSFGQFTFHSSPASVWASSPRRPPSPTASVAGPPPFSQSAGKENPY